MCATNVRRGVSPSAHVRNVPSLRIQRSHRIDVEGTETSKETGTDLEGHNRGHMLDQRGNLEHHIRGTTVLLHLAVNLRRHQKMMTNAKCKDE